MCVAIYCERYDVTYTYFRGVQKYGTDLFRNMSIYNASLYYISSKPIWVLVESFNNSNSTCQK